MASLNQCNFIGNVGKIESRYLANGDQVVNLSLACNEHFKDKNGEKQERTEWVNVTIFGKLAEVAAMYVTQGKQIYISGRMQTRKYTDKNGIDRYTTDIIATDMKMLGSKPAETAQGNQSSRSRPPGGFEDMDDLDIPFN